MLSKNYRAKSFKLYQKSDDENFKHGLNISLDAGNFDYIKLDIPEDTFDLSSFDFDFFDSIKTKIDLFNSAFGTIHSFLVDKDMQIDIKDKFSQFFIKVKANSNPKIIFRADSIKDDLFVNIYIINEENSNSEVMFFSSNLNRIFLKKSSINQVNSSIAWKDLTYNCSFVRNLTFSLLSGDNSSIDYESVYFSKNKEKMGFGAFVEHAGRNTKSNVKTRGVLDDESNVLMHGNIKISPNASNSEGYEKQDALVLSDMAKADAIPNLEIGNDKVKCSHGTSIGKIDDKSLFYLCSRGLSKDEAKRKIIEGYFSGFDEGLVCKIIGAIK